MSNSVSNTSMLLAGNTACSLNVQQSLACLASAYGEVAADAARLNSLTLLAVR